MSISIHQISYIHPDKEVLFSDLNFAISKGQKLGLVGNNGCGKSTLLQIIAGQLSPSSGVIVRPDDLYYIPQHFGQYDSLTIAQALRIERKQKPYMLSCQEMPQTKISSSWTMTGILKNVPLLLSIYGG